MKYWYHQGKLWRKGTTADYLSELSCSIRCIQIKELRLLSHKHVLDARVLATIQWLVPGNVITHMKNVA